MNWKRLAATFVYFVFLAGLFFVCFRRPLPGEFDRYMYEALVRGKHQSAEVMYPIIKHSYPRAEASEILDSPAHLAQMEPLYAIRPLYVQAIAMAAATGMPYQSAVSLVSAVSLFLMGVVLLAWTGRPFYSALLVASPAIVAVARGGTPDAFSALFLLASAWTLATNRMMIAMVLLLASVWVRTDNVLFIIVILIWLGWTKRLSLPEFFELATLACASLVVINHFAGNYPWRVLFRYTFIGGRNIAEVSPNLTLREYLTAIVSGIREIGGQEMAIFILIGLAAAKWLSRNDSLRPILLCVAIAATAHFLLFPSPDNRFFAWAYLIAGAAFIRAIPAGQSAEAVPD